MRPNWKFHYLSLFNSYLLAIWIVFIPKVSTASTADKKAAEGISLYQKQQFNKASEKFYEAHQEKPNDLKISYNLGNSRYKQGNYEKALQNYSKSMEQESNLSINQKTLYNMGNAFFRMNKFEESINAYKKALELNPSDMDAKFNLEFAREQVKKKQKKKVKQRVAKKIKNLKIMQGNQATMRKKKFHQTKKEIIQS